MEYLREKFFELPPIYGTIRAIDGTHIPIEAPQKYPARYINRKGFHSISFQVTVDVHCVIRNVFGGYLGCCHDAHLFQNSFIHQWTETAIPEGYFVIADAAYPAN